jgi:hypothetical protein
MQNSNQSQSTLRLAGYRQSVRLGAKPLEALDQRFFFSTELLRSWSLYNILPQKKMGLSLMNTLGFSSSVRIAHIHSMLLKILAFVLYASPLSVQVLQSRSCLSYLSSATTAA